MPKTTKIRQAARGESCQVRIPGWCSHNEETTILAHRNGGGMGMKQPDQEGAFCCSGCHSFIDGGWTRSDWTKERVLVAFYDGIFRTQRILVEKGLLKVVK